MDRERKEGADGAEGQESGDQEQSEDGMSQLEAGLAGCVRERASWKDEQGRGPRGAPAQGVVTSSPAEEARSLMEAREGW